MKNQHIRNKTDTWFSYYFGRDPSQAVIFSMSSEYCDKHCRLLLTYIKATHVFTTYYLRGILSMARKLQGPHLDAFTT